LTPIDCPIKGHATAMALADKVGLALDRAAVSQITRMVQGLQKFGVALSH